MSIVDLIQKDPAAFTAAEADALIQAIESPSTAPVPRVKATELVGKVAAAHEALVGKAFKALVAVLAGADDTPRLLAAAIAALVELARGATEQRFALVREGSDVLLQVALRSSGFGKEAQGAATAAFRAMLAVDFKGCIMKLLHWLSDEREEEEAGQLAAERGFATMLLGNLVRRKEHAEQWTEETQRECLQFAQLVLAGSTAAQYGSLVSIVAALPVVKEGKSAALLEAAAALPELESLRGLESVSGLAPFVPAGAQSDVLLAKLGPGLESLPDDALGAARAKALVLASDTASPEAAAQFLPAAAAALAADSRALWTTTEALLTVFANLGGKASEAFLPLLGAEAMQAHLAATAEAAKAARPKLIFAVKKMVAAGTATPQHGVALGCLGRVVTLTDALCAKKLPERARPSWDGKPALPASSQPKAAAGLAPPAAKGKRKPQRGLKRGASGDRGGKRGKGRKI